MQQPKNKKENQQQQEYQDDEQQVKQIGADNQQKVTKKKKKKKKHKRRHPPQYYEQRKVEKQNLKREKQWNDRFMVGSGLQQDNNSKTRLRLKSLKRSSQTKIKSDAYNTFNTENQNKSKPSKSFNIRIMTKKQDNDGPKKQNSQNKKVQKSNSKHKQKNTQNIQGSKVEEKNQKIHKTQKSQNLHKKQHQQMQNLISLVNEAHNQIKFPDCHKDILIQIIKKSNKKIIKSFIHAEIARLKSKTSCITNLESVLNKRQNMMIQFKQSQESINEQKITKYRVLTLRVIEQILKWKQQLQNSYLEQTGIKSKLCFKYMEQNYLLTICKDLNQKGLFLELKGDPFLLGYGASMIQQQLLIKIRACQMLLLQQQMDNY